MGTTSSSVPLGHLGSASTRGTMEVSLGRSCACRVYLQWRNPDSACAHPQASLSEYFESIPTSPHNEDTVFVFLGFLLHLHFKTVQARIAYKCCRTVRDLQNYFLTLFQNSVHCCKLSFGNTEWSCNPQISACFSVSCTSPSQNMLLRPHVYWLPM